MFLESSDATNIKTIIQDAVNRLDERLKAGSPDKASEKKVEHLKADLRHVILLAGTKNAQLAAAQDRILHFGDLLAQFYNEISDSESDEQKKKVASIQTSIRELVRENNQADEKPENDSTDEGDRDAKSPKLPAVNVSRTLLPKSLELEIGAKLQSGLSLNDIIRDGDRREKLGSENDQMVKAYESFQNMVKAVKNATENIIQTKMAMEDKDKAELCQQINKQKSLLNVKRYVVNIIVIVNGSGTKRLL